MARIKNIEAYCNSCGTVQKMEITSSVTGEESDFKKWAKTYKYIEKPCVNLGGERIPA